MSTCMACKQDIKDKASKCPHCQAYQTGWKNVLPLISTGSAILAVFVSVGALIVGLTTDVFVKLFGSDTFEVVSYSGKSLVISNDGSFDLFVQSVTEISKDEMLSTPYSRSIPVESIVDKKSLESIALDSEMSGFVLTKDKQGSQDVIIQDPYFYSRNNSQLSLLIDHYKDNLITLEGECTIHYRSIKRPSELLDHDFPCLAVITFVPIVPKNGTGT